MSIATIVVLSVFVLPKFEDFFASLDAELPLPTRILLVATRFLGEWWWLIVVALAALALLAFVASRTQPGRYAIHRIQLEDPRGGRGDPLREDRAVHAPAGVHGGRPASRCRRRSASPPAASRTSSSSGPGRARDAMLRGEGLAQPIAATQLFPGIASQMIRVGEETGTLDSQLEVAAEFYERELDYKVAKVTSVIEPVVITVMGGVVGFVAIALVSAMYGIFRTAQM